jgi:hypothetical protein
MPKPKRNETKKEYMGRCMNYPDMQKYPTDQRYAICLSMWKKHHKKASDGSILSLPEDASYKLAEINEIELFRLSFEKMPNSLANTEHYIKLDNDPEIVVGAYLDLDTKEMVIIEVLFHKRYGWTKESVEEWIKNEL